MLEAIIHFMHIKFIFYEFHKFITHKLYEFITQYKQLLDGLLLRVTSKKNSREHINIHFPGLSQELSLF